MLKIHTAKSLLLAPILASAVLSSCIIPTYSDNNPNSNQFFAVDTLPDNFAGDTYFYNGRYYSGGTYQTGRYQYNGNLYTDRYYYNGQYYYGGRYQNKTTTVTTRPGYRTRVDTYQTSPRPSTNSYYSNRRD